MTKKPMKIAVLGATGQVGREIVQVLAETGVPLDSVTALASTQSQGSVISYGDEDEITVSDAGRFDFTTVDMVISALPAEEAQKLLLGITKLGCKVIDCSPAFRMDPDVPLCVAGVNDEVLTATRSSLVALPDALTSMLCQAVKPLHSAAQVTRLVVSTYQSASGAGREAMDELFSQTRAVFVNDPIVKEQFSKQIAFNVIPHVGNFRDDGQTDDEFRLVSETKKIIDTKIKIATTCTRAATFLGSAMAVAVECANGIDASTARAALRRTARISVIDNRTEEGYVTPVEAAGENNVYVSRIRDDASVDNGVQLWVVGDTVRAGVAQNAVHIALTWLEGAVKALKTATVH